MDKCELITVCLSEVCLIEKGEIVWRNYTVLYSGSKVKAAKVFAVFCSSLRNYMVKCMTKVECYSNRLMFVKISAKPIDIVIV